MQSNEATHHLRDVGSHLQLFESDASHGGVRRYSLLNTSAELAVTVHFTARIINQHHGDHLKPASPRVTHTIEQDDSKRVLQHRFVASVLPGERCDVVVGLDGVLFRKFGFKTTTKKAGASSFLSSELKQSVDVEIEAVAWLVRENAVDGSDPAAVAAACLRAGVPFVDMSMLLDSEAAELLWLRPHQLRETLLLPSQQQQQRPPTLFGGADATVVRASMILGGKGGCCYFLSAMAAVATVDPDAIRRLFVPTTIVTVIESESSSSLSSSPSCPELGIWSVRLYDCTGWACIVLIDDLLPATIIKKKTRSSGANDGGDAALSSFFVRRMFTRSTIENGRPILFPSLAEKAFAKMYGGGYAAIRAGKTGEAFCSLLGSPYFELRYLPGFEAIALLRSKRPRQQPPEQKQHDEEEEDEASSSDSDSGGGSDDGGDDDEQRHSGDIAIDNLFTALKERMDSRSTFVCMSIRKPSSSEAEQRIRDAGLVPNHAYALMKLCEVASTSSCASSSSSSSSSLLRFAVLQNPTAVRADSHCWKGAWGHGDPRWTPDLCARVGVDPDVVGLSSGEEDDNDEEDNSTSSQQFVMEFSEMLRFFSHGNWARDPQSFFVCRLRAMSSSSSPAPARFCWVNGAPTFCLRIQSRARCGSASVCCMAGIQQRHVRATGGSSKDYESVRIAVVRQQEQQQRTEIVYKTPKFRAQASTFAEFSLDFDPQDNVVYHLLPICFHEQTTQKNFTLSLFLSSIDGISVSVVPFGARCTVPERWHAPAAETALQLQSHIPHLDVQFQVPTAPDVIVESQILNGGGGDGEVNFAAAVAAAAKVSGDTTAGRPSLYDLCSVPIERSIAAHQRAEMMMALETPFGAEAKKNVTEEKGHALEDDSGCCTC